MLYMLLLYMVFYGQDIRADEARKQKVTLAVEKNIAKSSVAVPSTTKSSAAVPEKKKSATGTKVDTTKSLKLQKKDGILEKKDEHHANTDHHEKNIQNENPQATQKIARHQWPQKNSLIKKLEQATEDIPQRSKDNRKTYKEKVSIAYKAYKALYDYNRSSKLFMTKEENHRVMQAVTKLFEHKHIENMVWHANIY